MFSVSSYTQLDCNRTDNCRGHLHFCLKDWQWVGPKIGITIDDPDERWDAAHAMVGLLACCFAWFQPIMALFRCHPEKKFRLHFQLDASIRWTHRVATRWFVFVVLSIFLFIKFFDFIASAIFIACKHFTELCFDSRMPLYLIMCIFDHFCCNNDRLRSVADYRTTNAYATTTAYDIICCRE